MKHCIAAIVLLIVFSACSTKQNQQYRTTRRYTPDDAELYKTIVALDSGFFYAYNTCGINLDLYASYYSDSIEFYHDKGGFTNSKKDLIEGTKKNICGKVTRELVKGSIEVYPLPGYGAIEIGLHQFHNNAEPGHKAKTGRFTIVWKKENDQWKIMKVISLH
jgi:ketosteroid isomerase-like protein